MSRRSAADDPILLVGLSSFNNKKKKSFKKILSQVVEILSVFLVR